MMEQLALVTATAALPSAWKVAWPRFEVHHYGCDAAIGYITIATPVSAQMFGWPETRCRFQSSALS